MRTPPGDFSASSENSLERRLAEAEAANAAKTKFISSIGHELRTPLNAIIGFSSVLQREVFGDLNEKQTQYIGQIETSGRELLGLIDDLLSVARVEAGREQLNIELAGIADLVNGALAQARELAAARAITLNARVPAESEKMQTDARRLKQALADFVAHAAQEADEASRVEIEVTVCDGEVRFTISGTAARGFDIADDDAATGQLILSTRMLGLLGGHVTFKETDAGGDAAHIEISVPLEPDETAAPQPRDDIPASNH